MTDSNTKPTKPGWWWANVYGRECVVEVFNYNGELAVFFPGNEVETCVEDEAIEWIRMTDSIEVVEQLRQRIAELESDKEKERARVIGFIDEMILWKIPGESKAYYKCKKMFCKLLRKKILAKGGWQ
jgi:hypothetical protein